jgi:hypothetical protein
MRFGIASIAKWSGLPATRAGIHIVGFHSGRPCRETILGKAAKPPHRGRAIRKRCNAKAHCTLRLLNPLPVSRIEWLKQQSLRVAAVFRPSNSG